MRESNWTPNNFQVVMILPRYTQLGYVNWSTIEEARIEASRLINNSDCAECQITQNNSVIEDVLKQF